MSSNPARVFLCSGHMVDAPGRTQPRFPPHQEEAVRQRIAGQLAAWNTGPQDLGISSGACGADILFAEACLERGVRVLLLIALPEDIFLERSVRFADANWEARYRALRAGCETRFQHEVLGPVPEDEDAFERNNLWCLETAYALVPPGRVASILVWDEKSSGDGPGGTAHFASRVAAGGGRVSIINPTQL